MLGAGARLRHRSRDNNSRGGKRARGASLILSSTGCAQVRTAVTILHAAATGDDRSVDLRERMTGIEPA